MTLKNLTYPLAIIILASCSVRSNDYWRNQTRKIEDCRSKWTQNNLTQLYDVEKYLVGCPFWDEALTEYADIDEKGNITAFGARGLDDAQNPKYLNSSTHVRVWLLKVSAGSWGSLAPASTINLDLGTLN